MPMSKFFDAVSITAVVSITLTQMQSQGVKFELLHYNIKFHPDQTESVRENEANRFRFILTWSHQKPRSVKMV